MDSMESDQTDRESGRANDRPRGTHDDRPDLLSRSTSVTQADLDAVAKADELAQSGSLGTAVQIYRAVLHDRPDFPGAWNNLGCALSSLGDCAGAILAFQNAHSLNPDFH